MSLIGASEVAKKILAKFEQNYLYQRAGPTTRKRQANVPSNGTVDEGSISFSSPRNNIGQSRQVLFATRNRKTLTEYVERWLTNTKMRLDFEKTNCAIDNENKTISCKICPSVKSFSATLDSSGCWKISSFVSHLKAVHFKNDVAVQENVGHTIPTIQLTSDDLLTEASPPKQARIGEDNSNGGSVDKDISLDFC